MESHLGGHKEKTHLDQGLLMYLKKKYNMTSFLDIGCGTGGMVQLADKLGFFSEGIEGDKTVMTENNSIILFDFTKGIYNSDNIYDLGYSVEFLEHIDQKYIPNYMSAFQLCKYIVITAAPVGSAGHHHVNCQDHEYWIKVFNNYGFYHYPFETKA